MSNYNPSATYAELLDAIAQGHNVTAEHLAQAKERDNTRADADAQAAQIARDIAAAQEQRTASRKAHDEEHQSVLAAMLEELNTRRTARTEAAAPLREARAAYNTAARAVTDQYRAIRDYVAEHYGDQQDNEGEDTYIRRAGGVVVAGQQVEQ